ncbi:NAD-dependent protein deacetylase [bioreactor metagenome]|uniref:NAD-dependent protein deacetylase n=1 Tax=bioreactor metagenome TaxID=1076179 RepID=A0A645JLI9_9ZZZZ
MPLCDIDHGIIKPDVVLYEEPLDRKIIDRALEAISTADTMFVIGTSLVVYPANTFVRYFQGRNLILINKSETRYDSLATITLNEDVIKVVEELERIGWR